MPKISVILTSYNHEKFLPYAIESVLNQTIDDFELIIWDDCSSDKSWEIIKGYSDTRIKCHRNHERKRSIFGINKSIKELSTGSYIAIHHSDDIWHPDKLRQQLEAFDSNPHLGAVFTNALAINETGLPLEDKKHFYQNIFDQPNRTRFEWLNFFFTKANALCHPSVLIRKQCYLDCGAYRHGLAQLTDFDMWIRLCMKYEIYVLNDKLIKFRVLNNNANTSGARPETIARFKFEFFKLLDNFKNIDSIEDLIKIFPVLISRFPIKKEDSLNSQIITKFDVLFLLAFAALNESKNKMLRLFGLGILYDLIGNSESAKVINKNYNFDYQKFIALTGDYDLFVRT
jgi:glycosyltransferase involved in cell wall biosynthesis